MILQVAGLHAAHGQVPALTGIDLTVPGRAIACVVGPSGCGKTTLLRVVGGFHLPTAGRIELDGTLLDQPPRTHVAAERRRIGYIPQDGALFPHLSVAANIGFGLPRRRRAAAVSKLLKLIDLPGLGDRYPHELSGGQQQRVAIARALAAEPALLLLDEPFTALDAGLRAQVRGDVVDLLRATGTTAILVTHDPGEALAIADQITIMEAGRIIRTGTPDELHARPGSVTAARALGDCNIIPATASSRRARSILGELELDSPAPSGAVSVLIRPAQILVESAEAAAGVPARVQRMEFRGENYRFELRVEDGVNHGAETIVAFGARRHPPDSLVQVLVKGQVHLLTG